MPLRPRCGSHRACLPGRGNRATFDAFLELSFAGAVIAANDDDGWDPTYDFDANNEVDFTDFFLFAEAFSRAGKSRTALLALAVEHLGLPLRAILEQNAPNPFNNSTTIPFHLLSSGPLRLEIYDVTGQLVRTIDGGDRPTGTYQILWNGRNDRGLTVASGLYFYRSGNAAVTVPAGFAPTTHKMLLLK